MNKVGKTGRPGSIVGRYRPRPNERLGVEFDEALKRNNTGLALQLLGQLRRTPEGTPDRLMAAYHDLAVSFFKYNRLTEAADYFLRALEVDVHGEAFGRSAVGLVKTLEAVGKQPELTRRCQVYLARLDLNAVSPATLEAYSNLYVVFTEYYNLSSLKILELGDRIFEAVADEGTKASFAQSLLFHARVLERSFCLMVDRTWVRKYAEYAVAKEVDKDPQKSGVLETMVIDLDHFEMTDLLRVILERNERTPAIEMFLAMRDAFRSAEGRLRAGNLEAALYEVQIGLRPFERLGNEAVELENRVMSYELRVQTIYLNDLLFSFHLLKPEEVRFDPASLAEEVLLMTGEEKPELAKAMDRALKLATEGVNQEFMANTDRGRIGLKYATTYHPSVSIEKGRLTFVSRGRSPVARLAIELAGSERPLVYELRNYDGKLAPCRFDPSWPLVCRFVLLRGLVATVEAVGEKDSRGVKELRIEYTKVTDALKEEVRKFEAQRLAARREELRKHFLARASTAEALLAPLVEEMMASYYAAVEVVDRLTPGIIFPRLEYDLAGTDYLAFMLKHLTLEPGEKGRGLIARVSLRDLPEKMLDEPLALAVDLSREKVALVGSDASLGTLADFVLQQTAAVLARYLSAKLLPKRYAGYVVDLEGGEAVEVSHRPGPALADVFDRAFDQLLRTQGILAFDLFQCHDGLYRPLTGHLSTNPERAIKEIGAEQLFINRQVRGRINRLRVAKVRDEHGGLGLGSYKPTPEAITQQAALNDPRPLLVKYGLYIVTTFADGREHLLPVRFVEEQGMLFTKTDGGQDVVDQVTAEVESGKYRDPHVLLRTTRRPEREHLQAKMQEGSFTQRVEVFEVKSTYYRPKFERVSDLLRAGYQLKPAS